MLIISIVSSLLLFNTLPFIQLADSRKSEQECTGEFEFWSCQSPTRKCQRNCENYGVDRKQIDCNLDCEKACVCEAGYLRNGAEGECIYETECPNFHPGTIKKSKIKNAPKKVTLNTSNSSSNKKTVGGKLMDAKSKTNGNNNKEKNNGNGNNKKKSKPKRFAEQNTDNDYDNFEYDDDNADDLNDFLQNYDYNNNNMDNDD